MKYTGEIVGYITEHLYKDIFVNNAEEYLQSRGISNSKINYPWFLTPDSDRLSMYIHDKSLLWYLESSLIIPIVNIYKVIVGYDIRYLGFNEKRPRYIKVKLEEDYPMIYNLRDVIENPYYPLVITEGAMDCESLRSLNIPVNVISPLRNRFGVPFCRFILSLSDNIYLCYDRDKAGIDASKKILSTVDVDYEFRNSIKVLNYSGKDPNDALIGVGGVKLKLELERQIDFNTRIKPKNLETFEQNLKI